MHCLRLLFEAEQPMEHSGGKSDRVGFKKLFYS